MITNVFKGFPLLLKLLPILIYCIMLWGHIRIIMLSKKLKKNEVIEIVSKKTSDELRVANIIVLIGWVTVLVINIIDAIFTDLKTY